MRAAIVAEEEPFFSAKEKFHEIEVMLSSREMMNKEHSEIESYLKTEGFELLRRMMQAHLDLRREQEQRVEVIDVKGITMTRARLSERDIETLFGTVRAGRLAYSKKAMVSLHPLDGQLNLSQDLYSHGVRRLVAEQISKESIDEVVNSISKLSGATVAKRQVEELAQRAAADFDSFYATRSVKKPAEVAQSAPLLVIQTDGKGIVMRKEDLREVTRKAAEVSRQKMSKRLSRGEKHNRKRMAQVASVYTIEHYKRTPEQIVNQLQPVRETETERPKPEQKRIWASVEKSAGEVIEAAFEEAHKRDPKREKNWVAVVDGNKPQLDQLKAFAIKYGVTLTIVLDLIHVIEYLWRASYVFNERETPEAEQWVSDRLLEILRGNSSLVAGGIRRSATLRELKAEERLPADDCADYLIDYGPHLHYDQYLAKGLPIATGVIEGACRHLVKDRMDLTGARWGLKGAEAVLKLRSLRSSGDFDEYWQFHLRMELQRNHKCKFFYGRLPAQKPMRLTPLRLVK